MDNVVKFVVAFCCACFVLIFFEIGVNPLLFFIFFMFAFVLGIFVWNEKRKKKNSSKRKHLSAYEKVKNIPLSKMFGPKEWEIFEKHIWYLNSKFLFLVIIILTLFNPLFGSLVGFFINKVYNGKNKKLIRYALFFALFMYILVIIGFFLIPHESYIGRNRSGKYMVEFYRYLGEVIGELF